MKKTLQALALCALTISAAMAQNTYQAAQFRHDMCDTVGRAGMVARKFKEANVPYDRSKLADSASLVLTLWAVNYGLNQADSREDAYKTGFAKCMDNIDMVYANDRAGLRTREDQLR
jgi:hypothetical protein